MKKHILLYGPPGSGKSTLGKQLARRLARPFVDLDEEIVKTAGMEIAQIFAAQGQAAFRQMEHNRLATLLLDSAQPASVISLGGGALLEAQARALAETHGQVVLLSAPAGVLLRRILQGASRRPLLAEDPSKKLAALLEERSSHYDSFHINIPNTGTARQAVNMIQRRLGIFHITGMGRGYDALVYENGLQQIGQLLQERNLRGPIALISDSNVAPHYASSVLESLQQAGYTASLFSLPAGETHKTLQSVSQIWDFFLKNGLDRHSTVLALGGGVIGDLAGFAAASYLRGINWVCLPTTLLAMADASLGGKTGFDLPQGKNLIGAFHPPRLVLADPATLNSLPGRELRAGLAEALKSGLVADAGLYQLLYEASQRPPGEQFTPETLREVVTRSMAVKIDIIQADPYEKGRRAALNLGHTLGHAVELASGFSLLHGEAVTIGLVLASQMAERLGVARQGLTADIRGILTGLGLPVDIPAGISPSEITRAATVDKKKAAGQLKFVLPVRPGRVQIGVDVPNWQELVFGG